MRAITYRQRKNYTHLNGSSSTPNNMDIEAVLILCRKHGVKNFTCPEFSFELDATTPVSNTPENSGLAGTPLSDSSGVPTDDEFLFMATAHYDEMLAAKEILKQPPEPK